MAQAQGCRSPLSMKDVEDLSPSLRLQQTQEKYACVRVQRILKNSQRDTYVPLRLTHIAEVT